MNSIEQENYQSSKEDVARKIEAARIAQVSWSALSLQERARRLKVLGKYIASNGDEFAERIHNDNGKLKLDALVTEILPAVMAVSYYCKRGQKILKDKKVSGGNLLMFNKQSRMIHEPYGVVGIISPWNYPFAIPFSEVIMALLAGNGVILKTATSVPGTGRLLAEIFQQADIPENLFSYVELQGKDAGPAFIEGGVDKLFFTGSTAVGKELMELAAPKLLPLVLELVGADAAIVCADADLDRSALGILWAGFSNAGQSCGGVQRILVHQDVYETFVQKLSTRIKELRIGSSVNDDIGPMISLKQKKAVQKQVAECVKQGAIIAAQSSGDLNDETLFVPAILLTNLTKDMPITTDEVFGPVAGIYSVQNDDEAVRIANASPYGLTASVWSKNYTRAKNISRKINAGAVMINDHLMSHGLAETPWGGFGDSGIGRTHGEMGLLEMVKTKVVVNDTLPGAKRNLWWHPYSEKVYSGMEAILQFVGVFKLSAIPKVIKIFFSYWKA
jgi:succinate-semialdehyde dehydrogenase/glutarate-semialdehyde dehydrogenase